MNKAYKFKLRKLTDEQKSFFGQCFGHARFVYNWALTIENEMYEKNKNTNEKKHLTKYDLYKLLTSLKKQEKTSFLNDVPIDCLRGSIDAIDIAFEKFFKHQGKYPKRKNKFKSKKSCKIGINQIDFDNWKVKIAKIGWIKICKNKTFDLENCKICSCTISCDSVGDYWISISIDTKQEKPKKVEINKDTCVGIDVGLKTYATLSNGIEFENPKWYAKSLRLLKIRQRKFSRTKKGSKRHERAKLALNKIHRKITNQRLDYLCKLVSQLTSQYDTICIEDLNINGILKNHKLARSVQSAAWGTFFGKLIDKSNEKGKNVLYCGRFDATTQTCNCCGHKQKMDLDVREWICPNCGIHHDRDLNAAINIMEFALKRMQRA